MERSAWPKNLSSSRKRAIKELLHGQKPTKNHRHLFDAHSQTGNDTGQPLFAEDLVVNVIGSFSNTLSLSSGTESDEVLQVRTNACVRSEVSEGSESIKSPVVPRKTLDTRTRLDQNLIDDGHQRRTFDQKLILKSELPREFPIEEILKFRIEVRKRLGEQPEVQKVLRKIREAQGKHQQAIIEKKAQKSLSLDGSDPANPQGARAQIVDLNLALSNFVGPAHEGGGGGGERNNNKPVFFDFLRVNHPVNHELKLPSEDDLNPHGHSHDDNSSNNNNQSTSPNCYTVFESAGEICRDQWDLMLRFLYYYAGFKSAEEINRRQGDGM